jgi:hypothetical protein
MSNLNEIKRIIGQNLPLFAKPGILSVRPGYRLQNGWVTATPAIVVTVENSDALKPQDQPPATIGGVPVDIRVATPLERLRASKPGLYARVAAAARPEASIPAFDGEHSLVTEQPTAAADAEAAALRAPPKPQISYEPPAGVTLDAVTDDFTITCNASPDAGWTTLKSFFGGVEGRLTVGMYDFTSRHVLEAVQAALDGKDLTLTLDHPAKNPSADQSDEDTLAALQTTLGDKLQFAWALVRSDPLAAQWIYPTAYHIKVAVRDGTSFWLSSGNWNNSNQPDIDPWADPATAQSVARRSDRDWHVVVENKTLSNVFEQFLLNDREVAARSESAQASLAGADGSERQIGTLAASDPGNLVESVARPFKQFFKPQTFQGRMKVQPVLTPDNYWSSILPLIQSTRQSFYMQTQYMHPSDNAANDAHFMALIEAVRTLIDQGRDVRLILSQWQNAAWLERLQGSGIDLSCVRIQVGVHNKGMIVDQKIVALGSHNWSAEGTLRNRDATLIIDNADIAAYFNQIFLHDWDNVAVQQIVTPGVESPAAVKAA